MISTFDMVCILETHSVCSHISQLYSWNDLLLNSSSQAPVQLKIIFAVVQTYGISVAVLKFNCV